MTPTVVPPPIAIRAEHLARERSLRFAIGADAALIAAMSLSALLGGSMTMMAESVRALLMLCTEIFAFVTIRRIHRGQVRQFDFGPGKLEQLANVLIAAGMLGSSIWICVSVLGKLAVVQPPSSSMGLAFVAVVGSVNTYFNWIAWLQVKAATPPGSPVIMQAQLRSRSVKLLSSCFVQLLLTVSAVSTDPGLVQAADLLGAAFVVIVMVSNARDMLRSGLPDLLDRAIDEAIQMPLNRALVRHFADFDRLGPVRTRRSGQTVFIDLALGFDAALPIGEIDRRVSAISATIRQHIANADVRIATSAAPAMPG